MSSTSLCFVDFSDDEHDVSDDSGTEDPHIVVMDRNQTRAENERQKNRDQFLKLEQGSLSIVVIDGKQVDIPFDFRK
jgi:hypothetical protein